LFFDMRLSEWILLQGRKVRLFRRAQLLVRKGERLLRKTRTAMMEPQQARRRQRMPFLYIQEGNHDY